MNVKLFDVLQRLMAINNVTVTEIKSTTDFENIDLGFRKNFYPDFDWLDNVERFAGNFNRNTLYIVYDMFNVCYAVFGTSADKKGAIVIGPYVLYGEVFDNEDFLKKGFSSAETEEIKHYWLSVPHIHEDIILHQIYAIVSASAKNETIEVKYLRENLSKKQIKISFVLAPEKKAFPPDDVVIRYKTENEILEAVSQGNYVKLSKAMRNFPVNDIGERYSSIHKQKKTLIILNTLFRKSLEKANVHPYHIDEISYRYFQKIDFVSTRSDQAKLINEMMQAYCDYAKRYSVEKYSPVIQKALNFIQLNIANKISLKEISEICKVSPNHLARQFRTETGRSVVDFINYHRIMIAADKIKATNLSIAEISAAVGINDVNYFSRIFRKYMDCSPSEYRR